MSELNIFSSQNQYISWMIVNIKIPLIDALRNAKQISWEAVGALNPTTWRNGRPFVVTFTGGMGAQIISAAIYFRLKEKGRKVYADLTYFEKSFHVAVEGNPGDISQWDWQLQSFDLFPESFEMLPKLHRSKYKLIRDGRIKSTLGMRALSLQSIQSYFIGHQGIEDILPEIFHKNYLCIHIRRGDYVNVATHMVSDDDFIEIARKVTGLISGVVIVSDSIISDSFRQAILGMHQNALFLDKVDAVTAHRVMRNARVLICSNSQFSLVAALLNRSALVIMPKKWFGDKHQKLATPISELCNFQILKSN